MNVGSGQTLGLNSSSTSLICVNETNIKYKQGHLTLKDDGEINCNNRCRVRRAPTTQCSLILAPIT